MIICATRTKIWCELVFWLNNPIGLAYSVYLCVGHSFTHKGLRTFNINFFLFSLFSIFSFSLPFTLCCSLQCKFHKWWGRSYRGFGWYVWISNKWDCTTWLHLGHWSYLTLTKGWLGKWPIGHTWAKSPAYLNKVAC